MGQPEFQLIQHYFQHLTPPGEGLLECGIGDDAAVVDLGALAKLGSRLLVSTDTLGQGTHFLPGADATSLGYKALAVNISDIFAMGGVPTAFTLCLSMPTIDHEWLTGFSQGLGEAAKAYDVFLIGGDTTRGPLSISIQIFGVSQNAPLLRSGATPGDLIAVTGTLGDSAAGLQFLLESDQHCRPQEHVDFLVQRHIRPIPRQGFSAGLPGLKAAIDISDGFLFDLEHICVASKVSALLDEQTIPLSQQLKRICKNPIHRALIGGEDYELCLIVDAQYKDSLFEQARQLQCPLSFVGEVQPYMSTLESPVQISGWSQSQIQQLKETGFAHFKAS